MRRSAPLSLALAAAVSFALPAYAGALTDPTAAARQETAAPAGTTAAPDSTAAPVALDLKRRFELPAEHYAAVHPAARIQLSDVALPPAA
jgi:hypothetical protein